MFLKCAALVSVAFAAIAMLASAADDPVKADLDAARAKHAEVVEAAKVKLSASIESKLKEVAGKGDLEKAKEVKLQLESFEKEGVLPKSPIVSRAKADYETDVRVAKETLRKALEVAKGAYTKALKLEQAEAIAAEIKLGAETPPKQGPGPGIEPEPKVVGTWAHQVGTGKDAARSTFKLYSNGKINSPDSRNTWHIKNGLLTLAWQNANAPGGKWEDVCNLSSDGKSYSGKNNKGIAINGVKLASGDIDAEKKK